MHSKNGSPMVIRKTKKRPNKGNKLGAVQDSRGIEAWQPSHNQPVHLTPKARAFFSLAISERNVAFAKSSLAFGAGDQHVI